MPAMSVIEWIVAAVIAFLLGPLAFLATTAH